MFSDTDVPPPVMLPWWVATLARVFLGLVAIGVVVFLVGICLLVASLAGETRYFLGGVAAIVVVLLLYGVGYVVERVFD